MAIIHTRSRTVSTADHGQMRAPNLKSLRTKPCPACGAEIGEPCMTNTGNLKHSVCTSRRRIIVREMNEQRLD